VETGVLPKNTGFLEERFSEKKRAGVWERKFYKEVIPNLGGGRLILPRFGDDREDFYQGGLTRVF